MSSTSSLLRSMAGQLDRPAEDEDQCIVQTPYGRGLCIRTRKSSKEEKPMREIRLLDWETLTPPSTQKKKQQQPTLYSVVNYPSVKPMVGDDVICLFGRGRVDSIIGNEKCVVKLSSWRLAGRSLVTCHLSLKSVKVVRKKILREMNVYERVAYAQIQKKLATRYFSEKNYQKALTTYATAVDAVRYVQHDASSNNEVRADLLVLMITCCNNAATCSVQLSRWDDAVKFSKNALVLLDALYNKRGLKIHTILNKEGYSDAKCFGEWRVKSYLVMGRAMTEKGDYSRALERLKKAHELVVEYSQAKETDPASVKILVAHEKERKRLHHACIQRKKADKKKEKERAVAMFGNETNKSEEAAPAAPQANVSPSSVLDMKDRASGSGNQFKGEQAAELDVFPSPQAAVAGTKKLTPQRIKKRVSFSEVIEFDVSEDEEEEEPWYEQHKEALILTAACGLAVLSASLLQRSRK